MNEYMFRSSLANRMSGFIALKRLSGTPYITQTLMLKYFDQFLMGNAFKSKWVTRDIYERYAGTLTRLNPRYRWARCNMVRQFCIYLSRFEPRCYVPDVGHEKRSVDCWRAYIFTKQQVQDLLTATGALKHWPWFRPQMYRTLFGLLYTTGLRIAEALALNLDDFYPDTLRIHVRSGKFRKARWVPVSPSTGEVLKSYIALRQQIVVKCTGAPMFISLQRKRLAYDTTYSVFCKLLRQCGIQKTERHGPRIHDLRHTFAVHRLLEWYRDGKDINARLPALATYMGHVWISSTQVYIQATPELYECANQRFLDYVRKNNIATGRES